MSCAFRAAPQILFLVSRAMCSCRFNLLFFKRFCRLVRVVFPRVCSKSLLLLALLIFTQSAGGTTYVRHIQGPPNGPRRRVVYTQCFRVQFKRILGGGGGGGGGQQVRVLTFFRGHKYLLPPRGAKVFPTRYNPPWRGHKYMPHKILICTGLKISVSAI